MSSETKTTANILDNFAKNSLFTSCTDKSSNGMITKIIAKDILSNVPTIISGKDNQISIITLETNETRQTADSSITVRQIGNLIGIYAELAKIWNLIDADKLFENKANVGDDSTQKKIKFKSRSIYFKCNKHKHIVLIK